MTYESDRMVNKDQSWPAPSNPTGKKDDIQRFWFIH